MADKADRSGMGRRSFLTGAMATAVTIIKPELVRGAKANSTVDVGLIGCGGRGGWIANLFQKHGGYKWVACADYFPERAQAFAKAHKIPAANCHSTLSGYKKLLEGKLDAVVIESPPYFHPEQAAAGVDAGKHVYVAKPIAVDVPGCLTIGEAGKKATGKKLVFLIDFQTRADPFYCEALKRVRAGAIGRFAFGESTYHAGIPWGGQIKFAKQAAGNPEARLRSWGLDKVLSGDIITEQNIHTLDVASWIMDSEPVCAFGTGEQKVRDFGTCWDTFSVTFRYPENVGIAFSSRQFNAHGTQPDGIRNRMFGSDGVLETKYGGQILIRGKNFYRGGRSPGIFKDGAVANIAAFHKSILAGDYTNATAPASVRSNLVTILGRTAAYKGDVVTWDSIMKAKTRLDGKLKGLKS